MQTTHSETTQGIPRHIILVFFLLAAVIGIAGYFYYDGQKKHIVKQKENELTAVADLKTKQIVNWRKERLADAEVIFKNRIIARQIEQFIKNPSSPEVKKELMEWMTAHKEHYAYRDIFLFDPKGKLLLAFPGGGKVEPHMPAFIENALRTKKVEFTDFHREGATGPIHLSLVIPVMRTAKDAIGVFIAAIEPYEFLYPLIQTWPVPSDTGETLLVRRDGDDVLFLNELRHRKNTALTLRFPVGEKELPAAMTVRGQKGIVYGKDYRGVAVAAYVRDVPGSPWFIVSKVDQAEVYAPVRRRTLHIGLIIFLAIVGAGLFAGIVFIRQRAAYFHRQYETESRLNEEIKKGVEELRESESKFRHVFESANVGKSITLPTGKINVNKAFADMLGYAQAELSKKTWQELTPSDEIEAIQNKLAPLLSGEKDSARFEKRYIHRNGSYVWADVSVAVQRDIERKPLYFLVTIVDITERKRAEQMLQDSEEKYRRLFETTKDGLLLLNGDTKLINRANPAALEMLGRTQNELVGLKLAALGVFKSEEEVQEAFRVLHRDGYARYDSILIDTADKGLLHADMMLVNRSDIIQCNIRDFTEKRKAEEFIKSILESVDEGFIVIDKDYRIISANRAYCEQQKARLEDIIGKHCYEVSHGINTPCFEAGEECSVRHVFETGKPYTCIHTHYDSEDNPVHVETKSFPMKDLTGNIYAAIEVINDISEKRRLEDQLRHAQKMEAIGTLAGGIAHDFNNLLNVMLGYAGLMQLNMKPDDPFMPQLKEIIAAGERAAHLTKGLLTFSRKQTMEVKTVNLNEIIEGLKKMLGRIIGEDIELRITLHPPVSPLDKGGNGGGLIVKADVVQIEQVLMNLAANARDAMPKGGTLSISAEAVRIDSEFLKAHHYGEPGRYALV